jgi:hypothetical protein
MHIFNTVMHNPTFQRSPASLSLAQRRQRMRRQVRAKGHSSYNGRLAGVGVEETSWTAKPGGHRSNEEWQTQPGRQKKLD